MRKLLFYLAVILATLVVLASLASLVNGTSYWYSQVLDFPRPQYLVAAVVLFIVLPLLARRKDAGLWALLLGLAGAILIQAVRILPYYMGEQAVPSAEGDVVASAGAVGIMLANVLQPNQPDGELLNIVRQRDPDMLLAMEVDDRWMAALAPLKGSYPHRMEFPTSNGYGMVLYSKLPLRDTETMFFSHDSVPSMHATVTLPDGRGFRFHGVHPVAPVPSSRYPDAVGDREIALGRTAELVRQSPEPDIVAGDFNDVSWSHTARMFEAEGLLNNVRLGRGLYNTFNAHSSIMRWPLDHYFVTDGIALTKLERLPSFGSDHFPMYAGFAVE